jgi:protein TonB
MPSGPTAGWIAADTIPFADLAKLSGGNNEYRVMIDAAGKPTDCHVQWPTLDEATNRTICDAVMQKGAFLPALDQSGQAMDSYWTTSAFFLMPPFGRP